MDKIMIEISHEQARRSLLSGAQERLSEGERQAVEKHLAKCVECRLFAASSETLQHDLRRALHARWDPQPLQVSVLPFVLAKTRRQAMISNHLRLASALILSILLIAVSAGVLHTLRPQPAARPNDGDFLSKTQSYQPQEPTSSPVAIEPVPTSAPQYTHTAVITYTVRMGDSIFHIAEEFDLKPETILWGNTETLGDNPHMLIPGMVINILPVDGVYYRWSEGDTVEKVAGMFDVAPEAILSWPGNRLDPSNPNVAPGTMIVVPGGKRDFVDWGIPIPTGAVETRPAP